MKFSLITITLNAEKSLRRCISSVLEQSRLPNEYIFVDGGSTDGTESIINDALPALIAKGIDAKLVKQVHTQGKAGIPEAWNQGITRASGDIIALLNSDDYYSPDTIRQVCNAFEENPDAEIVTSPIAMVDENGTIRHYLHPKCLCMSEIMMPLPHPGTFIRSSLYNRIGLYNENYRISADYDLIWRSRKAGAKIVYRKDQLVSMEAGGLANSSRPLARKETLKIALEHSRIPLLARAAWLLRVITGR